MAETTAPLPAPTNRLLNAIKIVLDNLIKGLGEDAAISAATAAEPWLAWPVVKQIFAMIVSAAGTVLDEQAYNFAAILTIRAQNNMAKYTYDGSIAPIQTGSATPAELQAAKDAMDKLINRNKP